MISRGGRRLRPPISVAQVSALAAARAPAKAAAAVALGRSTYAAATPAATAPFAAACTASRRDPRCVTSAICAPEGERDSRRARSEEEAKKDRSTPLQRAPPARKVRAP